MTGVLLALCFGAGIGLLLLGFAGYRLPTNRYRLRPSLALAAAGGALLGWIVAWSLCHVPVVALATAAAGAYAPYAWGRRRSIEESRQREASFLRSLRPPR